MSINYDFLRNMAKVSGLPIEEVARRIGHAEFQNNPMELRKSRSVAVHVLEKGLMDSIRNMFGRGKGADVPSAPASSPEVPETRPFDAQAFREKTLIPKKAKVEFKLPDQPQPEPEPEPKPRLIQEGFRGDYLNHARDLHRANDEHFNAFKSATNWFLPVDKHGGYFLPFGAGERASSTRYPKTTSEFELGRIGRDIANEIEKAHDEHARTHGTISKLYSDIDPDEDLSHPDPQAMAELLQKHDLQFIPGFQPSRLLRTSSKTGNLIGPDEGPAYTPHSQITQELFKFLQENDKLPLSGYSKFWKILEARPDKTQYYTTDPVAIPAPRGIRGYR